MSNEPTGLWPETGGRGDDAWLAEQAITCLCRTPTILATSFTNERGFRERLIRRILELESDPELSHWMPTGGRKVKHMHRWDCPEADVISERALSFYSRTAESRDARIDMSWASVYRTGDYLSPHGHPDATGTIVYCLDSGDPDHERNVYAGALVFVDPRIEFCCSAEENCVTRPMPANLRDGTMVLFPGTLMHFVHPYNGTRPRITLSWNIN